MAEPTQPTGPAPPPRRPTSQPDPPVEPRSTTVDDVDVLDDDLWVHDDELDDHDDHFDDHDDHFDDHDDEFDDDHLDTHGPRSRPGGFPRWVAVLGVAAVLLAVVAGAGWVWYERQVDPPGAPGETVTIDVPSGVSVRGIGAILEDRGVITNATVFNFYAGRRGAGPFQAGVYELRLNSDFDLVLATLEAGPVQPLLPEPAETLTIPEGLVTAQILDRVAEGVPESTVEGLQATLDAGGIDTTLRPADQPSYEGLLFPATYELTDGLTGDALLQQMAGEMEVRLQRLGVAEARARIAEEWGLELTDYDLLKVASMVQAEAGNVEEAPQIATVIYNRLAQGMPLGIDAVDRYGAALAGTDVDYEDRSAPYNTRRNAGLPPTPIAAPGEFALEAALRPASGPWLYYVLTEPRSHVFVTTNAEFLEAKRVCIERELGCG